MAAIKSANEAQAKKEVDQFNSAYMESFRKQDPAGMAALYATGGVLVNPRGVQTDLAKFYADAFKAGFNQVEVKVDQAWPLGTDAVLATGTHRTAGKSPNGAPLEGGGLWTAAYVREGGGLKIRMLTGFPPAPPPKN